MTQSIGGVNPEHSNFMFDFKKGVQSLKYFSQKDVEQWLPNDKRLNLEKELAKAIEWYDKIISLQKMDQSWTYQIEFGLFPTCLYQVRPFKPIEYARFSLPREPYEEDLPDASTIVIGVTPPEGLTLKVVREDDVKTPNGKDQTVFVGEMRQLWKQVFWTENALAKNRANVIENCLGFLAHCDVKAMRQAQVTGMYTILPSFRDLKSGDWINIKSDGKSIKCSKV